MSAGNAPFQPELSMSRAAPAFDARFATAQRIALDERSWLEHQRCWVDGTDSLFDALVATSDWQQRTRRLFDKRVPEPRLTARWTDGVSGALHPLIDRMRDALGQRYGVHFDSVGFNLYRDGRDSVAWHRDHIARHVTEPVVALVSLGSPRRLLLRPHGGGRSQAWDSGHDQDARGYE